MIDVALYHEEYLINIERSVRNKKYLGSGNQSTFYDFHKRLS